MDGKGIPSERLQLKSALYLSVERKPLAALHTASALDASTWSLHLPSKEIWGSSRSKLSASFDLEPCAPTQSFS